jgi:hypothetical protein
MLFLAAMITITRTVTVLSGSGHSIVSAGP